MRWSADVTGGHPPGYSGSKQPHSRQWQGNLAFGSVLPDKAHFPMLYLFYGPDEFSRSEALRALRASLPVDLAALNSSTLDGRKLKLDELVRACEAVPFLAEKRLVVVTDALKHIKAGKERDELRAYLETIPATCDLVFVESAEIDKRSSLFTYLKKAAQVQVFELRTGNELIGWINERVRLSGVQIEPAAVQRLIDYIGNDGRMLASELAKLSSYIGSGGGRIGVADVDLLVQDTHEQNLFAFIDDLSLRQGREALKGLRALLADGQAATYIVFMLARQVRILLGVQALQAMRMSVDEMAVQLKQKPFVIRKAASQVRRFAEGELSALHDQLLAIDHAIKTGRVQADVALEMLVMDICHTGVARHMSR